MRRHRTSKGRFTKKSHGKRRRKRNGSRKLHHAARAAQAAHAPKRRRKRARKARSTKRSTKRRSGRRIRPTIIVARSGKYFRPRRSKYFRKPRKVNGRRRARRHNGSKSIMAAVRNVFQVRTISRYASIGGGIFAGTLFSRMLNTGNVPFTSMALPASITSTLQKIRPVHGLIHILAGTLIAGKSRNKYIQDAGLGLAALGGFDLLMQVLSKAGVMNLPTFSGMNVNMLPGRAPRVTGMNVDLRSRKMAGMNVNLMGDDVDAGGLADDLNASLS